MEKFNLFIAILILISSDTTAQLETMSSANINRQKAENKEFIFEENKGQITHLGTQITAQDVKFIVKTGGHKIFLLTNGLAHQFEQIIYPEGYDQSAHTPEKMKSQAELSQQIQIKTHRMDMILIGSNPNPRISTGDKSENPERYYKHQLKEAWSFEHVTYHDIYPNIDWILYTAGDDLKYDFIVHPGGDASQVQMQFKDAEQAVLQEDSSFLWSNSMGWVLEKKPICLQNGQVIESRYIFTNGILKFSVENYNPALTLRIDPALQWGTYYGGSAQDEAKGIATDDSGNVYITGGTLSTTDIASSGAHQTSLRGTEDIVIVKFNDKGERLWGTYYGGNAGYANTDVNIGNGIACDHNGNVFITGWTWSDTGMTTSGAYQTSFGGYADAFVAKFSTNGALQWGTYFGGSSSEMGCAVATDKSGNVFVTGEVGINSGIGIFPDVFVLKFSNSGVAQWVTYFGEFLRSDIGYGIATDDSGYIYVTGKTQATTDISTSGSHQSSFGGFDDAFVVKLNNNNGTRIWGTYYGGSNYDIGRSIATDRKGNVFVTGETQSSAGIATSGAHQTSRIRDEDVFVVKFNSNGVRQWGTYYGGSAYDLGTGIDTDSAGNAYIVGYTGSLTDIASSSVHQSSFGGQSDAFVAKFDSSGKREWASYYGGNGPETASGIAVGHNGRLYFTGYTGSGNNVATAGVHQTSYAGSRDIYVASFTTDRNNPHFTSNPRSRSECSGTSAHFSTTVSGVYDSLQWQQYAGINWVRVKGGLDTFYNLTSADTSMNGDSIRVIAYGIWENDTSVSALLSVKKITAIISEPQDSTTCEGIGAAFNVEAEGSNLSYQWQIDTGSGWSNVSDTNYSGETSSVLSLSKTYTFMDGFLYRCLVYGDCDADTSESAQLAVNRVPLITSQPQFPKSSCSGDTVRLELVSIGSNLRYQWQKNNGNSWENISGAELPVYTSAALSHTDSGMQLRCVVSGSCSPADTSDIGLLTIYKITEITMEPIDSTTCEGTGAAFNVEVEGNQLSYQWQMDTGTGWSNVSGTLFSGETSATLLISSTLPSMDSVQFRCLVYGACGADSSEPATLRIYNLPLITMQPSYQGSSCGGDTVRLEVGSYGTQLNYQWQKNIGAGWVDINSAERKSYTTGVLSTADDGTQIRCILTGICTPSDTSDCIVLNVRGDRPSVDINGISDPSPGQANGSIDLNVGTHQNPIRFSRWSSRPAYNYPQSTDFNLSNARDGKYYLLLITSEYCMYYFGPYYLGKNP